MIPECSRAITERDIDKIIQEERGGESKKRYLVYIAILVVLVVVIAIAAVFLMPNSGPEPVTPTKLKPSMNVFIIKDPKSKDFVPVLNVVVANMTGQLTARLETTDGDLKNKSAVTPSTSSAKLSLPSAVYGEYIVFVENSSGVIAQKDFAVKGDLSLELTGKDTIIITKSSNKYYIESLLTEISSPGDMTNMPSTGVPMAPMTLEIIFDTFKMNTTFSSGHKWIWPGEKLDYIWKKSSGYTLEDVSGTYNVTLQILDKWGNVLIEEDVSDVEVP